MSEKSLLVIMKEIVQVMNSTTLKIYCLNWRNWRSENIGKMLRGDFYLKQSILDWKPEGTFKYPSFSVMVLRWHSLPEWWTWWILSMQVVEAHLLCTYGAWKIHPSNKCTIPNHTLLLSIAGWLICEETNFFSSPLCIFAVCIFALMHFVVFLFSWMTH